MKIIEAPNGTPIHLFADSKEMPSKRYSQFQKYLLMDAGIGSDMQTISRHFTRLYGYITEAMTPEALKECENLHFNIYTVLSGISFTSLAFACLVAQVGDLACNDISEEGLTRTAGLVSDAGLSVKQEEELADEVKKKIGDDLKLYFPRIFPDDSIEFYSRVKEQLLLQGELMLLDESAAGDPLRARLAVINRSFLETNRPQSFRPDDPENASVELEKAFSALCATLDSNGVLESHNLTVFEFYGRLDYLNRQGPQKP